MQKYCLIFLYLIFFSHSVYGAGVLDLKNNALQTDLASYISFIEDPEHKLTFNDVRALAEDQWQANEKNVFNQSYNPSRWWLRISTQNSNQSSLMRLLEVSYPVLDYLDVYLVKDSEKITYELGDKKPFYERIVDHRNFVIPVEWGAKEAITIYLSVKSSSSIQVPLTLWEERTFFSYDRTHTLFHGLYYGIMLVMVMYNFFVYLSVGERNYLYYVLFVFCLPMFLASLSGFAFQYLWPNHTQWNDQVIIVMLSGAILFGIQFTHSLLKAYELHGPGRYLGHIISGFSALLILLTPFFSYSIMIRLLIPFACIACSYGITLGLYRWWEGKESAARYYTTAWSFLLVGGVVLAMNKYNILPKNLLTDYATQIGSALEVMLLSFALAERINQERKLRFVAQSETLASERELRKAQENTLEMQKASNQELASKNQQIQSVLTATTEMSKSRNKQAAGLVALQYLKELDTHVELTEAKLYLPEKNDDGFTAYTLCKNGLFKTEHFSEKVAAEKSESLRAHHTLAIKDETLILPIQSDTKVHAYLEVGKYRLKGSDDAPAKGILEGIAQSLVLKLDNLDAEEDHRLSGIGSMAAAIVHDLKNPIGAIIGYADLARDHELKPDERDEYLDIINQEALRLSSMAHEVLEFSRGDISLNKETINSQNYWNELKQTLVPITNQGSIQLSMEINTEEMVSLDKDRIRRVIINLATNACDAMITAKTIKPEFKLRVWNEDDKLIITAEDNGPGIPQHIQANLFEPFVTHGKSDGTGLGMAIVKKMVRAHEGSIDFSSALNRGTCFRIVLPQSEQKTVRTESISELSTEDESKEDKSTLGSILVTDDNPVNLKLIQAYLSKMGYHSVAASSAEEAIERLQKDNIALVLMDIEMPEESGIEATKRIRATKDAYANTPIVALTGHSEEELNAEVEAAGMNGCLSKPIQIAHLEQVVKSHLFH